MAAAPPPPRRGVRTCRLLLQGPAPSGAPFPRHGGAGALPRLGASCCRRVPAGPGPALPPGPPALSRLPRAGRLAPRCTTDPLWKCRAKYTVRPVGMKKTGGRDHTGRLRVRGIGGGHKRRYRMIDFQRLRYEEGAPPEPFTEKVINVRYDPCRSADIALVAGGNRKRWIIATENMQPGDSITNSPHIGRMAVSANEGDAYPLGALPVGTLICNLESHPGKGAQYIRAAGVSSHREPAVCRGLHRWRGGQGGTALGGQ
uniref:Ribosomal protein L2 n=1 Tax=Malurus cyaneus samueli TaxID=2593467 RepID=A0A8C5X284_9PASS